MYDTNGLPETDMDFRRQTWTSGGLTYDANGLTEADTDFRKQTWTSGGLEYDTSGLPEANIDFRRVASVALNALLCLLVSLLSLVDTKGHPRPYKLMYR